MVRHLACSLVLVASGVPAQDTVAVGPGARSVDLRGANLRGVDLRGANLADADVRGAVFRNANVADVCLWQARIDNADFRGATGLSPQQLSAARWAADRPPLLDTELSVFLRYWTRRHLAGSALAGVNWWGKDLSGFDFAGANLRGAILIDAKLRGAILQRANLAGAVLVGADLTGADLRSATGLTASQLVSAKWDTRKPPAVRDDLRVVLRFFAKKHMARRSVAGAHLWSRDLRGMDFTGADLRRAVLIGADLRDAVLQRAKIGGVIWTGADISGIDLRGVTGLTTAMLASARWDAARPPQVDSELLAQRKFLDRKRFIQLCLDGANLWGRDLAGAKMTRASLRNVVLVDANLRGAVMNRVDLTGANLTRADLTGADLRQAKGLGVAQLLSARWEPDHPPALDRALNVFERLWQRRDLSRRSAGAACLWDARLDDAKFRGADLSGVVFVRGSLRGADLSLSDVRGASFVGADISGADFRGARNLTAKMILSARWDPELPPAFGTGFDALRVFAEKKRFEFDLVGAHLQGPDPVGVMGPTRRGDTVARFSVKRPPRLGMRRLVGLIRARELGRVRIDR